MNSNVDSDRQREKERDAETLQAFVVCGRRVSDMTATYAVAVAVAVEVASLIKLFQVEFLTSIDKRLEDGR